MDCGDWPSGLWRPAEWPTDDRLELNNPPLSRPGHTHVSHGIKHREIFTDADVISQTILSSTSRVISHYSSHCAST